MSFRPCALAVTALAACATASLPSQQQGSPDAPMGGHADAPSGGDGLPPHIDAGGGIDAPPGSCATPFSGTLATWSFVGESGSQAQTAATSMATGVSASPVTRASGLTVASGVGSINSSGWATGTALDTSKYYTFSVTPPSGCTMDLTQLAIDEKSSGTGPTKSAAATSADSFGQTTMVTINAATTPALSVTGATGSIEVRVYGYAASSASGTMRIQNTLSLSGALH